MNTCDAGTKWEEGVTRPKKLFESACELYISLRTEGERFERRDGAYGEQWCGQLLDRKWR